MDFAAPEQIRGDTVDARADVYGLGGVTFYALTGATPFARDGQAAQLVAHLSDDTPTPGAVRADVPEELDAVIGRALARDPANRQPTVAQFGAEALAAVGHDDTAAHWARPLGSPSRDRDRAQPADSGDASPPPEPVVHLARAIAFALVAAAIPALILYMLLP